LPTNNHLKKKRRRRLNHLQHLLNLLTKEGEADPRAAVPPSKDLIHSQQGVELRIKEQA